MNKSAVAVAADSAVTRGRHKVHISANKVFQLHKTMPIGIVIWNFADIFGLPWELVIKAFREQIHDRRFSSIQQVYDEFLVFMQTPVFLTQESQEQDATLLCLDLMSKMKPADDGNGSRQFNIQFLAHMDKYLALQDRADGVISKRDFSRRFANLAKAVCDTDDGPHALTRANQAKFAECFRQFICSEHASGYYSGFAVFGFGEEQLLPALHHCVVDGAPLGKLRLLDQGTSAIERLPVKSATMMAFAQSDATTLFMEGISPELKNFFLRAMQKSLEGFSEKIFSEVEPLVLDQDQRAVAKALIEKQIKEFAKGFKREVGSYVHEKYVKPVITSIDGLGKGDMADLARAMVELASIKKRVTPEIETVAGPVDVAVLSKSDGFVWIDRKYYFDMEMNRAFYARYFDRRYALGGQPNGQAANPAKQQ